MEYKRIENLRIEKLSATPQLTMNIVFYNPNGVGCKISDAQINIFSGKDTLGKAVSLKKVKLKPRNEFAIPVTSVISLPVLIKLSGQVLFSNKDVPVDIKGSFRIRKFIFGRKISFNVHEKFDSKYFSK